MKTYVVPIKMDLCYIDISIMMDSAYGYIGLDSINFQSWQIK